MVPSPKATTGAFPCPTQWQLMQPMLTARATGRQDFKITPNPDYISHGNPYVGEESLPVVYAGATPSDYEGLDVEGKVALVARQQPEAAYEQVQAAKAAGAALLLVHNTEDERGLWEPDLWRPGHPAYTITQEAGERLRSALATDPDLQLDVKGMQDSEYLYELGFQNDRVPSKVAYEIGPDDIATVRSDYREHDQMARREGWIPEFDQVGVGQLMGLERKVRWCGPSTSRPATTCSWRRFAQPHFEFPGYYWVWSAYEHYRARHNYPQEWWGPLVHPAVVTSYGVEQLGSPVARYRDAIRLMLPHYSSTGPRTATSTSGSATSPR